MNDLTKTFNLDFDLVTTENGKTAVSSQVNDILKAYEMLKESFEQAEKELREKLFEAMKENDIVSATLDDFTVSRVKETTKSVFDTKAFVDNENEDLVTSFSVIEKTFLFDEERFKEEHLELYLEYCTTEETVMVNTSALEKSFPNIYNKYNKVTVTKPSTLRIAKRK